jgi:enamine deaminase RidA (YjgF/YER057c/UK114 family)
MRKSLIIASTFAIALAASLAAALAQIPEGAEARLKEKNITLPPPPTVVANYVPAVRTGNLLFLAGSTQGTEGLRGKLGREVTVEQGYQSARMIGLRLLSVVRANVGSLDRVKRIVKVLGMVNSADGFGEQPQVVNGFSDLMVEVFGDAIGKHARSAVGMGGLPGNASVEIEMILEVE